jgi:uncharacterized membrane protein
MKQLVLMAHFILIAMGTGMSFSNFINVRLGRKETGDKAKGLALQRRTIAQFGDIVIAFIWLTGLALVWIGVAQGGFETSGAFYAKIAFVVLLTVCHGFARRTAKAHGRTGESSLLARLEFLIAGVWLSALAAIVLAVVAFQ